MTDVIMTMMTAATTTSAITNDSVQRICSDDNYQHDHLSTKVVSQHLYPNNRKRKLDSYDVASTITTRTRRSRNIVDFLSQRSSVGTTFFHRHRRLFCNVFQPHAPESCSEMAHENTFKMHDSVGDVDKSDDMIQTSTKALLVISSKQQMPQNDRKFKITMNSYVPFVTLPWCIPSYLHFHPLLSQYQWQLLSEDSSNTVIQILKMTFYTNPNDHDDHQQHSITNLTHRHNDNTDHWKFHPTKSQIAIAYRQHTKRHNHIHNGNRTYTTAETGGGGLLYVAIYRWETIVTAALRGRQAIVRDIIMSMKTMNEQQQPQVHDRNRNDQENNDHHQNTGITGTSSVYSTDQTSNLQQLLTTIQPDIYFPIQPPQSSTFSNGNSDVILFEYTSCVTSFIDARDTVSSSSSSSQQRPPTIPPHLMIGLHRHSGVLVYDIASMLLHQKQQQQQEQLPSCSIINNHGYLARWDQFCTRLHMSTTTASFSSSNIQIDSKSKVVVVEEATNTSTITVVVSSGHTIMGWKYNHSLGGRNGMCSIPCHWQFCYGTDTISTMTKLPNHCGVDNASAMAGIVIVGTSHGKFIVLNILQLHCPSMSCTLSPTIVDEWTSYQKTSCKSISDWLGYERRYHKQRSINHNRTNKIDGSRGLGIRSLSVIPEMYIPSSIPSLVHQFNFKIRYRFVWITMNGWILSTHIELSSSAFPTALPITTTLIPMSSTIRVRRKSKSPIYDGICHVHYTIKPIVYKKNDDNNTLLYPSQPIWNYFEHLDEATASFPVSLSSHGILWYNPLDQDHHTLPQPLPQLPNPDVRVLSTNTRNSSNNCGPHGAMATTKQKSKSHRRSSMIPKLNYISYDQIRNDSMHRFSDVGKTEGNLNDNSNDDSNDRAEISISRIRIRKPTTLRQHPTCVWIHPSRPLECILVGTPDCGLYMIESKSKIQPPRSKQSTC